MTTATSSNNVPPPPPPPNYLSPQRVPNRERRPRSGDERRDGSNRRRGARNRNSVIAAQVAAAVGQAVVNGNVASIPSKLDLPPGYGKGFK